MTLAITTGIWDPRNLTGLVAWYDAKTSVFSDAGNTLATNGQTVQQWNDKSGNGDHLSQATSGNRPTYQATGLNSRPSVRFTPDANRRNLMSGATAITLGGTTVSVFTVASLNSPATNSNHRILSYAPTATTDFDNDARLCFQRDGSNQNFKALRNFNDISITAMTYATPTRFGVIFNGTNGTCYKNNVAGTSTGSTAAFLASGQISIGSSVDGIDGWLDGDISEMVITSTALSSTERTNLDNYFKAKWGL